jgi:hypothetical protein
MRATPPSRPEARIPPRGRAAAELANEVASAGIGRGVAGNEELRCNTVLAALAQPHSLGPPRRVLE